MTKKLIALTSALVAGLSLSASAQSLIVNPDFENGFEGWTVAYSTYNSEGTWTNYYGQAETPEKVATLPGDGSFVMTLAEHTGATWTENLVYIDLKAANIGLQTGDVVHVTFDYTLNVAVGASYQLTWGPFIKFLVADYGSSAAYSYTTAEDKENETGTYTGSKTVTATVGDLTNYPNFQAGIFLKGKVAGTDADDATLKISNLKIWLNDDQTAPVTTWAGFPIESEGYVNTGDWMGYIFPVADGWVWSYGIESWVYLPEANVEASGAWMYVLDEAAATAE